MSIGTRQESSFVIVEYCIKFLSSCKYTCRLPAAEEVKDGEGGAQVDNFRHLPPLHKTLNLKVQLAG